MGLNLKDVAAENNVVDENNVCKKTRSEVM